MWWYEDGFSDGVTPYDLPARVVLTMTESGMQITAMTLLEKNSNNNLFKLSNMLRVNKASRETGTRLQVMLQRVERRLLIKELCANACKKQSKVYYTSHANW